VNLFLRLGRLVARSFRGLGPGMAQPDDGFAATRLPETEMALYRAMDPRDRDHACRVARRLLADTPDADPLLVRAALLHDVGKAESPYRLWERIAVHLWSPDERVLARLPRAWTAVWSRHRDHAERGAAALRAAGGDPRVADLIERHHRPGDDAALLRLARADEGA
jgi:putative nucleotidyltransferase with HDIG domain